MLCQSFGPIEIEKIQEREDPGSNATGAPLTTSGFTNADPMNRRFERFSTVAKAFIEKLPAEIPLPVETVAEKVR